MNKKDHFKFFNINPNFKFNHDESGYDDGEYFYPSKDLIKQKGIEFELDLKSIKMQNRWDELNCSGMAEHYLRLQTADLEHPIIIAMCGQILDGYHRIAKALSMGIDKLPAKRIFKMPKGVKNN